MALFKIFKGTADNFKDPNNNKINTTNSGYAYFTPDDGKFYIDVCEDNEHLTPVIGNYVGEPIQQEDGTFAEANRICINQKLFTYNDYDILDCGTADTSIEPQLIFNCGSSK